LVRKQGRPGYVFHRHRLGESLPCHRAYFFSICQFTVQVLPCCLIFFTKGDIIRQAAPLVSCRSRVAFIWSWGQLLFFVYLLINHINAFSDNFRFAHSGLFNTEIEFFNIFVRKPKACPITLRLIGRPACSWRQYYHPLTFVCAYIIIYVCAKVKQKRDCISTVSEHQHLQCL